MNINTNDNCKEIIDQLIKKYETKIEEKKRLNEKLHNDIVEGLILAMEDVVLDLKSLF